MTDRQWAAAIVLVIMLIGTIVLIGVGLSQPTPRESLINELRDEGIVVQQEQQFIDLIDSICPTINTSYVGLEALKTFMSQEQALDTLRVVRYSGYCE